MLEEDIDDTHLCIKCSSSIVGLESYVQHRKNNCSDKSTRSIVQLQVDHSYGTFDFAETSSGFSKTTAEEVEEKVNKSLSDIYDLPYDLGADVFFQSLELQSSTKQRSQQLAITTTASSSSAGNGGNVCRNSNSTITITSSGGKLTSSGGKVLTRKATAALLHHQNVEHVDDDWIESTNNSENLMKAVNDLSRHNKCDSLFKLNFQQDSPDQTDDDLDNDDDDDDEDDDVDDVDVDEDDIDENYEPSVPRNHTGGKWKPENPLRPILLRNSPTWDHRHQWEINDSVDDKQSKDNDEFENDLNPPPSHTKGKWVPGTKIIKLDYKEEVEIEKIFNQQYWCNTCNRKLATKALYERHLKSNLHLKRSEPEQQLEKVIVETISERLKKPSIYLNSTIYENQEIESLKSTVCPNDMSNIKTKRVRRKCYAKCEICKTRLPKYLFGKHLISHYHYRKMILNPLKSFDIILNNIHQIIQQSPFQCKPCRFYSNTEEQFLNHWNSIDHQNHTNGPGNFFCNYCKFECLNNNEMLCHLLSDDHKEVILAINRSVPIYIGKKIPIICDKCNEHFQYNFELRQHAKLCSSNQALGTASNDYQSKFICKICNKIMKSNRTLQKHLQNKHKKFKYYCTICKIDFVTKDDVKKHRNKSEHRTMVLVAKSQKSAIKKCTTCGEILNDLIKLKEHIEIHHPDEKCICPYCGKSFVISQELGRHVRDKICQPSTSTTKLINIDETMNFCDDESNISVTSHPIIKDEEFLVNFDTEIIVQNLIDGKKMECDQCNFKTTLAAELLFHKILHSVPSSTSNQTKLTCPICSKVFRKHSLRCHLRQHTNEKIFECQLCKMRFSRKHNLKTHIKNIHNSDKLTITSRKLPKIKIKDVSDETSHFQCDTCGKIFSKKYSLKQHINIHSKRDKRFSCPFGTCIFIGRNDYDLRIHLTVHSDEKKFQCNIEGCKYSGKSQANLKKHSKSHQIAEKEFQCTNCEFKTRISSHLKRHLRIHSGEKPYKCPHCHYVCNSSENLRKHVLTTSKHLGRSLYECQLCTNNDEHFQTNFQKEFRSHLVIVHRLENNVNDYIMF